jgi:putative ABC transport system ATP-binding protein
LENVELMLRLTGQYNSDNKQRARKLLEMLGLSDRMHALPRELSGGQQQRVAIARSLINNPTVVLADEPTASLDTERAYQVVETMAHLVHEQGRAGVMVTHDLRMVEYTDRIIHLLDGRLERIVSPDDDLSCLADPGTCQMIPDDVLGGGDEVAEAIA